MRDVNVQETEVGPFTVTLRCVTHSSGTVWHYSAISGLGYSTTFSDPSDGVDAAMRLFQKAKLEAEKLHALVKPWHDMLVLAQFFCDQGYSDAASAICRAIENPQEYEPERSLAVAIREHLEAHNTGPMHQPQRRGYDSVPYPGVWVCGVEEIGGVETECDWEWRWDDEKGEACCTPSTLLAG